MESIIGCTIDYNGLEAILLYDMLLQHNLLLFCPYAKVLKIMVEKGYTLRRDVLSTSWNGAGSI